MRLTRRPTPAVRSGFTLVELMVATALIILIMSIITVAFHTGMDSFRQLKAVGDMSESLRAAEAVIRRDGSADHLEDPNGNAIRISHPTFGVPGNPAWPGVAWHNDPTLGGAIGRKGYFIVRQPSPPMQILSPTLLNPPFLPLTPPYDTPNAREAYPYLYEGTEDTVPSFRATDQSFAFTVRLPGRNDQEVFSCNAPANMLAAPLNMTQFTDSTSPQFVSKWAEVSYFLRPTGVLTGGDDGTTQLIVHTLYRRVRVLSPSPVRITPPPPTPPNSPQNGNYYREKYPELSIATATDPANPLFIVNTPETVNQRYQPSGPGGPTYYPGRTDTIVDWRNYAGGPPIVRLIPSGIAETAPAPALFDGTIANADRYGADVVLNNVLSFHVQVLTDASNASNGWWLDPPGPAGFPRGYDTATSTARVKAMRIVIRVYDTTMKQTRQMSIIQDL